MLIAKFALMTQLIYLLEANFAHYVSQHLHGILPQMLARIAEMEFWKVLKFVMTEVKELVFPIVLASHLLSLQAQIILLIQQLPYKIRLHSTTLHSISKQFNQLKL